MRWSPAARPTTAPLHRAGITVAPCPANNFRLSIRAHVVYRRYQDDRRLSRRESSSLQLAEHLRGRHTVAQIVAELLADIDHVAHRLAAHPRVVELRDEAVLVGMSRTRQRHRSACCEQPRNNPTSAHDLPLISR